MISLKRRITAFSNHSVVVNTFHLTVMRMATFAPPLLALWYLLDVLNFDQYGIVAVGMSVIQLAALLTDAGLTLAAIQKASLFHDKKHMLGRLLGGVTGVKLMTSFAFSTVIIVFSLSTTHYTDYRPVLLLVPISIILIALQPSWLFLGIEKTKIFARITILGKMVYLAMLFLLVRAPDDFMLVVFADAAGNFVITALSYTYVYKLGISVRAPSRRYITYAFKSGFSFFISRIALASYQNTAVIFLGLFAPPGVVAVYSVAEQFYKAIGQAFAPLALALYPYMTREKNIVLLLKIVGGVFVFLFAVIQVEPLITPIALELMNISDINAVQSVLRILVYAAMIQIINSLMGYPLFTILQRLDIANKSIIFGAFIYWILIIITILLNIISPNNIGWIILLVEIIILLYRIIYCINCIKIRHKEN